MGIDRELATTALAKLYMKIPKKARKHTNPWVKKGIKIESKAQRDAVKGRVVIKSYVKKRVDKVLGLPQRFTKNLSGKTPKRKK